MVYKFVEVVVREDDEYNGPDELRDGPTILFLADRFDINAFGQQPDD